MLKSSLELTRKASGYKLASSNAAKREDMNINNSIPTNKSSKELTRKAAGYRLSSSNAAKRETIIITNSTKKSIVKKQYQL